MRRALLIGNSEYDNCCFEELPFCKNDVAIMQGTLVTLGFQVDLKHDLSHDDMAETISEYARGHGEDPDDIDLVYFTGHGKIANNKLCLIPTDICNTEHDGKPVFSDSDKLYERSCTLDDVIERFEEYKSNVIIILDVCRNGSYETLPIEKTKMNIVIIYATSSGECATGASDYSDFSKHLCHNIVSVGKSINEIIDKTTEDMRNAGITQKPCVYSSSDKTIFLRPYELTDDWFFKQNTQAIEQLGRRYCPDVNVPVGIEGVFDALVQNDFFFCRLKDDVNQHLVNLHDFVKGNMLPQVAGLINTLHDELLALCSNCSAGEFDYGSFSDAINTHCTQVIQECRNTLSCNGLSDSDARSLDIILYEAEQFIDMLGDDFYKAAETGSLFVEGSGGIGKSHLIADIVNRRMKQSLPSVLLLGQFFYENCDPAEQIMKMLGLEQSFTDFLHLLNEYGKSKKTRVLFCVDALNEGAGKKLWPVFLTAFMQRVTSFDWIALALTGRTYFVNDLIIKDMFPQRLIHQITHPGFGNVSFNAIQIYCEHYSITYDPTIMLIQEFTNPLFLRLFCESCQGMAYNNTEITTDIIFKSYLEHINRIIADKLDYSRYVNVVYEVIREIVYAKYTSQSHILSIDEVTAIIRRTQQKHSINGNLIDSLIHEDILTEAGMYASGHEDTLYITYEKLEDYVCAEMIYISYERHAAVDANQLNYIYNYRDVLREFICMLANRGHKEIYDILPDNNKQYQTGIAFIDAIPWRISSSFDEHFFDVVSTKIGEDSSLQDAYWDCLFSLASRPYHPLNAEAMHAYLLRIPIPERDAKFIPMFDRLSSNNDSGMMHLLSWSSRAAQLNLLDIRSSKLTALEISWLLISSNYHIRDTATDVLISILLPHPRIIIDILNAFAEVDDPYIVERLYAVAFGCISRTTATHEIKRIAEYTSKHAFSMLNIKPNYVIRDYAKCIINYAKAHGYCNNLSMPTTAMSSRFPQIPPDKEVKAYEAQLGYQIMHSMRVEYDRKGKPGGYGDFGRYTFQYFFSPWRKEINPYDLMNIALKSIYDRGYDTRLHGDYDKHCRLDRGGDTQKERIGKKYQWLALHELAAIVYDCFPIDFDEDYPSLRDYDPTLNKKCLLAPGVLTPPKEYYQLPETTDDEWIKDFSDFPFDDIEQFISWSIDENEFFMLAGDFLWQDRPRLGYSREQQPYCYFYMLVNMYFCRASEAQSLIKSIESLDLMGRWMPEPGHYSQLYNREFFWSEQYQNDCPPDWCDVRNTKHSVMLSYTEYFTERQADLPNDERSITLYKPSKRLVDYCRLKYGESNGAMYNSENNLVSFDVKEKFGEPSGLFFKKDDLLRFAREGGLIPIWTFLGEKYIVNPRSIDNFERSAQPHFSAIYHLDNEGKLVGKHSTYNEG